MKTEKPKNTEEQLIGKVEPRPIVEEMRDSYLDYAMSVIISRALPDVRDGLKPVHRRILYAMWEMGLKSAARFRKSATIVGSVLGFYHPHGDSAVYDSMVRMAQDFSLRYPLVHGQGNFGCFTKDTKVRLVDGRALSFEELIKKHNEGKKHYTYTFNHQSQQIEIAQIKSPRLTRKNEQIMKVVLDNGQEIRCTLNHRFMLRGGNYKEAQYLQPSDSLMPGYTRLSTKEDDVNAFGYFMIYQPQEAPFYNHRVAGTEILMAREDVYDLTVDGTHNFLLDAGVFVHNSMDGDAAAAYRYTESKLAKISEELLFDIERETVDFMPNFDGMHLEPKVLPAKLPNLLLNGTLGIAVGMATNIPPHNLRELCDGIQLLIENPQAEVEDLNKVVKGPDFPTGGIIYNVKDIAQAYATGRGSVVMRAKTEIVEDKAGVFKILVTEVPYQVNKATLVERVADLVRDKKLEGIKDLRDESSKEGVRVVIELKKDAYPKKVLNQLFNLTQLQESFHFNMVALVDGIQPRLLNLKIILEEYIKHRQNVVRRRTEFNLKVARDRAHILRGLKIALDNLDAVIKIIKQSADRDEAKVNLIKKFKLTEVQAIAILEMRLQQLANLERKKIEDELKEKLALIKELEAILASPKQILKIVKNEVAEIKEKYGDERHTQIVAHGVKDFTMTDLIPKEDTMVIITRDGYIKRLPPDTFHTQARGGKGVMGLVTKEEDIVEHLFTTTTHSDILFFTTRGRVFQLKAYDIPAASRTSKGQAIVNFLQLDSTEKVSVAMPASELEDFKYLVMVTSNGIIKKVDKKDLESVRRSGLIAIKLKPGDQLKWVKPSTGGDDVMIVTSGGQSIRFKEKQVRPMGRAAAGVHGIRLKNKDQVVGMDVVPATAKNLQLFVISSEGLGKRTPLNQYRLQGRGGSGVKTANVTAKTGALINAYIVNAHEERDLVMISKNGQVIRLPFGSVRVIGRSTQGVRLMRFKEAGDQVASVTLV